MQHNQVLLIGFVGKEVSSSPGPKDAKRVSLRVATHYTTKLEGTPQYHTVWHDVIAWDETALYAERNFVKGRAYSWRDVSIIEASRIVPGIPVISPGSKPKHYSTWIADP